MKSITVIFLFACLSAVLTSCIKSGVTPVTVNQNQVSGKTDSTQNITTGITGSAHPTGAKLVIDPALAGNWTLVTDSIYLYEGMVAGANSIEAYAGQPGDYFNVTTDGHIYIKEGARIDTVNYEVQRDNSIQLTYTQFPHIYLASGAHVITDVKLSNVTDHTLRLYSNDITPGGLFARIFELKK